MIIQKLVGFDLHNVGQKIRKNNKPELTPTFIWRDWRKKKSLFEAFD